MLGGERDRLAEAETEGLIDAASPAVLSALLAMTMMGLSARRTALREMPVGGGQPGAGVDDEQDRVAVDERGLRLRAHAAGKRGRVAFLEAGRVDDGEGEVGEPRLALAPVAGDARLIVDQRELPARPAG